MEIWLDVRQSIELAEAVPEGVNYRLASQETTFPTDAYLENEHVFRDGKLIGSFITVLDESSQQMARSLVGSVEWLVLEFENWSMIPIENLIAACEGTPTKIAAVITEAEQANGAGFALEKGVDALIIRPDKELLEASLIVKSQRLEKATAGAIADTHTMHTGIGTHTITSVENGGTSERYCIDTTSLLNLGEGLLLGSSASSLVLVHGETVESEYVPPRPFRVNAGPPHAYVSMADGTTKYLSELNAGDCILLTNIKGIQRSATVGRLKIEIRPMVLIRWIDENNKEGSMFLQQAETVRVISQDNRPISVTSLEKGDKILGWCQKGARHIGAEISSTVSER
jgi:3-dehydroquinate synthase II